MQSNLALGIIFTMKKLIDWVYEHELAVGFIWYVIILFTIIGVGALLSSCGKEVMIVPNHIKICWKESYGTRCMSCEYGISAHCSGPDCVKPETYYCVKQPYFSKNY